MWSRQILLFFFGGGGEQWSPEKVAAAAPLLPSHSKKDEKWAQSLKLLTDNMTKLKSTWNRLLPDLHNNYFPYRPMHNPVSCCALYWAVCLFCVYVNVYCVWEMRSSWQDCAEWFGQPLLRALSLQWLGSFFTSKDGPEGGMLGSSNSD